jgi:hypothetical protein
VAGQFVANNVGYLRNLALRDRNIYECQKMLQADLDALQRGKQRPALQAPHRAEAFAQPQRKR